MKEEFVIQENTLIAYRGEAPCVAIPEGVKRIGEGAFRDCRTIREVEIPEGVLEIGQEAFQWCAGLTKVKAPSTIIHVGRDAFTGTPWYKFYCENETQWKEDFLFLGKCLVKARRNIRKAVIPEGTVQIAADAFFERVMLRELEIPDSVAYIGWRAFEGCTGLTRVRIPGSVRTLGWHCFKGCSRLWDISLEEGLKSIENGVFSSCRSLRHITFPSSLQSFSGWMFFECSYLETVHFSGNIREIKERTFSGCANLRKVNLPKGLVKIGTEAFYECTNLEKVELPDGLEILGNRAFAGARCFTRLRFPESLKNIGDSAFSGCRDLEEVEFNGYRGKIPDSVFAGCRNLRRIFLDSGIAEIGDYAFSGCRRLSQAVLPDSVRKVGAGLFTGCAALEEVRMPAWAEEIGGSAFQGCSALEDDNGFVILEKVFYGARENGTEVTVPSGTEAVASGAFRDRAALRSVRLPDSVARVGNHAFQGCENLRHVAMGPGVRSLGPHPFAGCGKLVTITTPGMLPEAWKSKEELGAALLGFCCEAARYPQASARAYDACVRTCERELLLAAIDYQLQEAVSYSMTHHTRQSALGLPYITTKEYEGWEYQVSEYTMSEIISSVYDLMRETQIREGILFLDEINCVSETLAPCMLQFLQYKVFGQHRIPDGWIIVTAGNPPEYNKSVRAFDLVTWDRLKRIDVEPDYEVWKTYAYQKGVHGAVTSYLAARQKDFYQVENTVDGRHFVTARGWDDLSEMLRLYEENDIPAGEDLMIQYLQHPKIAKDFAIYYDLFRKYRSDYQIEGILAGTSGESVLLRAQNAPTDERFSLLGLLFDAVTAKLRHVCEGEDRLEKGKRASSVSADQQRVLQSVIRTLQEYRSIILKNGGREEGFEPVRKAFGETIAALKQEAAEAGRALANVFSFCEEAFADGDEMLLLVTELTANYYSARFIGHYGCEKYYLHNKELQFQERKTDLIRRAEALDWEL